MRPSTPHALPCCLLVLAGLAAARPVDGKTVPSASELVDRSIAYHDPTGRLLTQPHHLVIVEGRPGFPDWRSEVLIDVPGERFEMQRRKDPP